MHTRGGRHFAFWGFQGSLCVTEGQGIGGIAKAEAGGPASRTGAGAGLLRVLREQCIGQEHRTGSHLIKEKPEVV